MHLVLANQYLGQIRQADIQGEILANTQIKISGTNDEESAKKIITSLKVSKEKFTGMKEHEFYLKTGDRRPLKFKPPGMLIKPRRYNQANRNPYLMDYKDLVRLKDYIYNDS